MPSGSVHTANSLSIAALLSGAAYFYDPVMLTNSDSVALVVGSLSGIFLTPDLDVDSGYIGLRFLRSIPIVGRFVAWMWRLMWLPYAILVPHRSWISHFPVISTIIRVVILFVFFGFIAFMYKEAFIQNIRLFFMWFVGLCISDCFHFWADWISGDLNGYSGKYE